MQAAIIDMRTVHILYHFMMYLNIKIQALPELAIRIASIYMSMTSVCQLMKCVHTHTHSHITIGQNFSMFVCIIIIMYYVPGYVCLYVCMTLYMYVCKFDK